MNDDGVYPGEMDTPQEFDNDTAEALLSGQDHGGESRVADFFGDLQVAYASQPPVINAELAAVLDANAPVAVAASRSPRRFERMRTSLIAKVGGATAALFAATGGLAVAHALPAPVQNAVAEIGIGAPAHHHGHPGSDDPRIAVGATSTTVPEATTVPGTTPTSVEPGDDNGNDAAVGRDENENENENECELHHDGDDTVSTTVPVTCVPITEPRADDDHRGPGRGDDEPATAVPDANRGPDNTTVTTAPRPDDDGGHEVTPTTISNSGRDGGGSNSGRGDGANRGSDSSNDG
jgi:hypothetical protein